MAMATPCYVIASLRRVLLLLCIAELVALHHQCHAFTPYLNPPSTAGRSSQRLRTSSLKTDLASSINSLALLGKVTDDDEDRSRPKIVVIKTAEDYVNFLEEDDRLCVVKFYANWCKSCQKFGVKFRHLAFDEGDRINVDGSMVHLGNVRFAEAEYSASAKLCKSLKVRKLPTVHMYRKGEGKIADMTCKPSLFHLVTDEVHRLMEAEPGTVESMPSFHPEKTPEISVATTANVTSTSFDGLANEIMSSLEKTEDNVGEKKEKNAWFPFSF